MTQNFRAWPVVLALAIVSAPLLLMYVYLFVDTLTDHGARIADPARASR